MLMLFLSVEGMFHTGRELDVITRGVLLNVPMVKRNFINTVVKRPDIVTELKNGSCLSQKDYEISWTLSF